MIEAQMVFAFVARQSQPSGSNGVGIDNRSFVIGCLWILRSGAPSQSLPGALCKWKAVHRRFSRWRHARVWERAFDAPTADRTIGT
ncbi:hypothetical protein CHY08_16855 [Rhizobium leguminosarum bv. viciae]|uniref:transposase n=2 Tax=Rhizobium leguminosarum TaxID=384 RepID=UPI000B8CCA1E|nr:hypothetical protein CHY08_16855 [Rhizobium leguminosarum bv. viciae]NKM99224.1 transposase [Rhizobium leguminosarum bv. viciae]